MKDELVNHKPKSGNYIINLESSTSGNGTHWLGCFVKSVLNSVFRTIGIIPPKEVIDLCKRIPTVD
jgi:hypothetical protein